MNDPKHPQSYVLAIEYLWSTAFYLASVWFAAVTACGGIGIPRTRRYGRLPVWRKTGRKGENMKINRTVASSCRKTQSLRCVE